ncbi:MAG TPA: YcgN family cysteine cluster protein [Devosia sp.]|nr:YcgN family cysteine cluster protein [Devosia sp.]
MGKTMPFWEEKSLEEMTPAEWESLCDGCGRCCLIKLEDEDSGVIITSDVRCRLLDGETCRCTDYPNRQRKVPDCVKLTPQNVAEIAWIPTTCAYRRLAEGRGLPWWHPLISGDPETVAAVGVSVRGRTFGEDDVKPGEWESHAVDWPEYEPPDKI